MAHRIDITDVLLGIIRHDESSRRYDQHLIGELLRLIHELEEHERHHPSPHRARHGRFAGVYHRNHKTGEITLAVQTVAGSTALTAPIIFTDSTGATVQGPAGTLTVDNAAVTDARLSADNQSCNVTSPATGSVTITWTDPSGNIAPFSVTLTDQVIPVTISGSFGTFAPGTTA